jgi:hypothetical protein
MNQLPFGAQSQQGLLQSHDDAVQGRRGETLTASQRGRTRRAVQDEYRGRSRTLDVNVGRPMIVRIDHYAKAIDPQDSRHFVQNTIT